MKWGVARDKQEMDKSELIHVSKMPQAPGK